MADETKETKEPEEEYKLPQLQTLQDYSKLYDIVALMNDFSKKGEIYRELSASIPDIDDQLRDGYGRMNVNSVVAFIKNNRRKFGHKFGSCKSMSVSEMTRLGNYARDLGATKKKVIPTNEEIREEAVKFVDTLKKNDFKENKKLGSVKKDLKEKRKEHRRSLGLIQGLPGRIAVLGLAATVPVLATGAVGAAAYQIVASALTTTFGIASGGAIAVAIAAVTLGPKIVGGIGNLISKAWKKVKEAEGRRWRAATAVKEAKAKQKEAKKAARIASKQFGRAHNLAIGDAYPNLGLTSIRDMASAYDDIYSMDMAPVRTEVRREEGAPRAEAPRREEGAPRVEAEREGEAPRREGEAPRREGEAPRREGEAPRREGEAPRREGEAPRREGEAPRREGEAPRREGEVPRREGEAPRREGEALRRGREELGDEDVLELDAGDEVPLVTTSLEPTAEERVLELFNEPDWVDLEMFQAENDISDDEMAEIVERLPSHVIAENADAEPEWIPYAKALSEEIARTPENVTTKDLKSFRTGAGLDSLRPFLPSHLASPTVKPLSEADWKKVTERAEKMAKSKKVVRESLEEKMKADKKAWVDVDLYGAKNDVSKDVVEYAKSKMNPKLKKQNDKNEPSRVVAYSDSIMEVLRESGVDEEVNLEAFRTYDGSVASFMEEYLDPSLGTRLPDAVARRTGDYSTKFLVSDAEWKQIKNRVRDFAEAGAVTTEVEKTSRISRAGGMGIATSKERKTVKITPAIDNTPVLNILERSSPELEASIENAIEDYKKNENAGVALAVVEDQIAKELEAKGYSEEQIYDLLGESENNVRAKIAERLPKEEEEELEVVKNFEDFLKRTGEGIKNIPGKIKGAFKSRARTSSEPEEITGTDLEGDEPLVAESTFDEEESVEKDDVADNSKDSKKTQTASVPPTSGYNKKITKGLQNVDKALKVSSLIDLLDKDIKDVLSSKFTVSPKNEKQIIEKYKNEIRKTLGKLNGKDPYTQEEIETILTAKDEEIQNVVKSRIKYVQNKEKVEAVKNGKLPSYVVIKIKNSVTEKELVVPKALANKIHKFVEANGGEKNPVAVALALENDDGLKNEINKYILDDDFTPTAVVTAMSQPADKNGTRMVPPEVEAMDPETSEIRSATSDELLSTEVEGKEARVGDGVKPIKTVNDILGTGLDVPPSFPNLAITTKVIKKQDGTTSVVSGAINKAAVEKFRDEVKKSVKQGKLNLDEFKAETIVKVVNEKGNTESKIVTQEEKKQLVAQGKAKAGPSRYRVKGGAKKIVTLLDSKHIEDMYTQRLSGKSKLKKAEKTALLQDCVKQLAEENPNIRPEIIASQLLTYSKATAKTVYDNYKVAITSKDIIPESLIKREVASDNTAVGVDSREEKISALQEKIRINEEKLKKSESHSNAKSAKSKALKERRLKSVINEDKKRLEALLNGKDNNGSIGGASDGSDGTPVDANKKVAEANKDEKTVKATDIHDEAVNNKEEDKELDEESKKEIAEIEEKIKAQEKATEKPQNEKNEVKTNPFYSANNGYMDIISDIEAGKYVDVEEFMQGKFDESDKANIRTWLKENGFDKKNEENKAKKSEEVEKTEENSEKEESTPEVSPEGAQKEPEKKQSKEEQIQKVARSISTKISSNELVDLDELLKGLPEEDKNSVLSSIDKGLLEKNTQLINLKEAGTAEAFSKMAEMGLTIAEAEKIWSQMHPEANDQLEEQAETTPTEMENKPKEKTDDKQFEFVSIPSRRKQAEMKRKAELDKAKAELNGADVGDVSVTREQISEEQANGKAKAGKKGTQKPSLFDRAKGLVNKGVEKAKGALGNKKEQKEPVATEQKEATPLEEHTINTIVDYANYVFKNELKRRANVLKDPDKAKKYIEFYASLQQEFIDKFVAEKAEELAVDNRAKNPGYYEMKMKEMQQAVKGENDFNTKFQMQLDFDLIQNTIKKEKTEQAIKKVSSHLDEKTMKKYAKQINDIAKEMRLGDSVSILNNENYAEAFRTQVIDSAIAQAKAEEEEAKKETFAYKAKEKLTKGVDKAKGKLTQGVDKVKSVFGNKKDNSAEEKDEKQNDDSEFIPIDEFMAMSDEEKEAYLAEKQAEVDAKFGKIREQNEIMNEKFKEMNGSYSQQKGDSAFEKARQEGERKRKEEAERRKAILEQAEKEIERKRQEEAERRKAILEQAKQNAQGKPSTRALTPEELAKAQGEITKAGAESTGKSKSLSRSEELFAMAEEIYARGSEYGNEFINAQLEAGKIKDVEADVIMKRVETLAKKNNGKGAPTSESSDELGDD